jgi:hypothetical protein
VVEEKNFNNKYVTCWIFNITISKI